ncbi:MAG: hypothetical protein ACFE0J_16295 [Elainellaceae cyanobacterium]
MRSTSIGLLIILGLAGSLGACGFGEGGEDMEEEGEGFGGEEEEEDDDEDEEEEEED